MILKQHETNILFGVLNIPSAKIRAFGDAYGDIWLASLAILPECIIERYISKNMIAIHDNPEGYVAHVALKIYINDAKLIFGKQEKYIANCNVLIA